VGPEPSVTEPWVRAAVSLDLTERAVALRMHCCILHSSAWFTLGCLAAHSFVSRLLSIIASFASRSVFRSDRGWKCTVVHVSLGLCVWSHFRLVHFSFVLRILHFTLSLQLWRSSDIRSVYLPSHSHGSLPLHFFRRS
jgi:hypothetical protein